MVGRKGIVNRVWEDIEAIVKEKDKDKYDEGEDTKLDGSADLLKHQYVEWKWKTDNFDLQSCESYLTKLEYWGAGQMTSLHSSLHRLHGLEKDDLAHHRIA